MDAVTSRLLSAIQTPHHPPIMKSKFLPSLIALALLPAAGYSQTINWGSAVDSNFTTNDGTIIPDSLVDFSAAPYVFELGAFTPGFAPTEANTADWFSNWRAFDRAEYSAASGYFTSSVQMTDSGNSSSTYTTGVLDGFTTFEGLKAYLWVRNTGGTGTDFAAGDEFSLTRSADWVFPTALEGCCDNGLPLEWSVSDIIENDYCEVPNADATLIKTGVAGATTGTGTNGLIYGADSVFKWDLYSETTTDGRGTAYDGVDVIGDLTITGDAVFQVIQNDLDFSTSFWQQTQTWSDIFSATGDLSIEGAWGGTVLVYDPNTCTSTDVSQYGHFSISGTTLNWSPIPEPSSLLAGLLLAAGLLRRRRD